MGALHNIKEAFASLILWGEGGWICAIQKSIHFYIETIMTFIPVLQSRPRIADRWYLGIDGGGTKCRALLVDGQGRIRGEGVGGSANAFNNLSVTCDSIVQAARHALVHADLPENDLGKLYVSAGLAGVNVATAANALAQWQHPFASFSFMSDLKAACLGAHAGASGRVIILGTGSCGAVLDEGQFAMVGGHGLALGDDASGAWLGREAIRYHLLAKDGLAEPTLISQALNQVAQQMFNQPVEDWVGFMQHKTTADYAKFSFAIIQASRQGDKTAQKVLQQALNYVSQLAERLNHKATKPLPLVLMGGLVSYLRPELESCVNYREAAYPSEVGALLIPEFDTSNA
jgi:glucosamine kinase